MLLLTSQCSILDVKDMIQHYLEHHYEGKEGADTFRIEGQ